MSNIDTITERIRADLNESLKSFVGRPNTPEVMDEMQAAVASALDLHTSILMPREDITPDEIDSLRETLRALDHEPMKMRLLPPDTITLTLPSLPVGAIGWSLYREPVPLIPYERRMKSRKWWRRRNKKLWRAFHSCPSPVVHIRTFEEFQQVMGTRS